MEQDWLFALPKADVDTQREVVREWLAADPAAAAISDEEAEQFFVFAFLLWRMRMPQFTKICKAAGVRHSPSGPKGMRKATLLLLRKWPDPKHRDLFQWTMANSGFGPFPDPVQGRQKWTEPLFVRAFSAGANIAWLVNVRRQLGLAENLSEWLQSLAPWAERLYRLQLDVGRLTLRRIVYPDIAVTAAHQEAAPAVLASELREKDHLSGALRHDVRRAEQDRKRLKERARQAEREARTVLAQARGEVIAARKALADRLVQHRQELAEQARRFEVELDIIRKRLEGARLDFSRSLGELIRCDMLHGRTVSVDGPAADQAIYRQLVESLGGKLVPEGGQVALPAPSDFAGLERALRSVILQQVLIKCDGLYRRREGRPGIAMSGFEVHLGDHVAHRASHVVCCGPAAGSLMAEYGALAMALNWLLTADPPPGAKLEILSDCKTMLGRLRLRRPPRPKFGCVTLDATVRRLLRRLSYRGCQVIIRWVPREQVHTVDRLCFSAYRDLHWYRRSAKVRPAASLEMFLRNAVSRAG